MSKTSIASDKFTSQERQTLAKLLDTMIPANEEFGAPSASSESILNDVVRTMSGAIVETTRALLHSIDEATDLGFSSWNFDRRYQLFNELQRTQAGNIRAIGSVLLQCYYRDDAVLESLGMEARPPFPLGNKVDEGDWSLLTQVKSRGSIYRRV